MALPTGNLYINYHTAAEQERHYVRTEILEVPAHVLIPTPKKKTQNAARCFILYIETSLLALGFLPSVRLQTLYHYLAQLSLYTKPNQEYPH